MDYFFSLPVEIILLCVSSLDESDISRLVQTCRRAQSLLTPTLQTLDNALDYGIPERKVLFVALIEAAQYGHVEIVERLLDHGAPTELQPDEEQPSAIAWLFGGGPQCRSPLAAAVVSGHLAVVSLLLARGARTDVVGQWGYSPLHHACEQRDVPTSSLSLLLAAGADIYARNQDGVTPVDLASGDGIYARTAGRAILRELCVATGGDI